MAQYDNVWKEIEAEALRVNTAPLDEHQHLEELRSQYEALRGAIGQIGAQRSCEVSRLYWYTDLGQGQAEAVAPGSRSSACGCSAS